MRAIDWRASLLPIALLGSLVIVLFQAPIAQDPAYHEFADRRSLFGVPNFANVASNLLFLVIGVAGLRHCLRLEAVAQRTAWLTLFAGITLVGPGSAYYHWNPADPTLVWDRLPMTLAFMGFAVALWGEQAHARSARYLLLPAVLLGLASVWYWRTHDDLRLYAWVQLVPLLVALAVLLLYRDPPLRRGLLLLALALYAGAKVAELRDEALLAFTRGVISGHTLKHLLAAGGCYSILLRLQCREAKG